MKTIPAACQHCKAKKRDDSQRARTELFVALIKRRLTPIQLESFTEEWEAICVAEGWARPMEALG